MKKKWLENAQKRIDEKEEENKRQMAAVKVLTTGSKWQWNPAANLKEKQIRKNKTEKPVMSTPRAPTVGEAEQPRQRTKRPKERTGATTAQINLAPAQTCRGKSETAPQRHRNRRIQLHTPRRRTELRALAMRTSRIFRASQDVYADDSTHKTTTTRTA